ncbi:MAG: ribosome-associated protein [Lentisphaeria bacterium]|jgi:ribosome-associated protein
MNHQDNPLDEELDQVKSKTKIKQEMQNLQDLGTAITLLKPSLQARIPLSDELRDAIEEAPRITQKSARKRHYQFIGKLMRNADFEAITLAYESIQEDNHRAARQLHLIERWRDRLLSESSNEQNSTAVSEFFTEYPQCDKQLVRQLIRSAQRENQQKKAPTSARKLFKLVRDTVSAPEQSDD